MLVENFCFFARTASSTCFGVKLLLQEQLRLFVDNAADPFGYPANFLFIKEPSCEIREHHYAAWFNRLLPLQQEVRSDAELAYKGREV